MNSKFWAKQTITENTVWDALVACGMLCSHSGADICNAFRYEDNTCKMARICADCDYNCKDSDEKVEVFIDYSSVVAENSPDTVCDADSNLISLLRTGVAPQVGAGNVYINGRPVCDDGWGMEDAKVVCRMLGYSAATAVTWEEDPKNGPGEHNDFCMESVECTGDESAILDCPYSTSHDCNRLGEAAGVICKLP